MRITLKLSLSSLPTELNWLWHTWGCLQLRVYTAADVVNELERAKIEYLEASVNITSKKKIILPKLLHWHMRDFADDMESLVEWIYSQLPRSGSLKRMLKECLSRDPRIPLVKMVELQPYRAEFRYLLPSQEPSHFMSFFWRFRCRERTTMTRDPDTTQAINTTLHLGCCSHH